MVSKRLRRKASRVERDEVDVEFNEKLGALKRERDGVFQVANATYEQTVTEAKKTRADLRRRAETNYQAGRDLLLKELAGRTEVVPA